MKNKEVGKKMKRLDEKPGDWMKNEEIGQEMRRLDEK